VDNKVHPANVIKAEVEDWQVFALFFLYHQEVHHVVKSVVGCSFVNVSLCWLFSFFLVSSTFCLRVLCFIVWLFVLQRLRILIFRDLRH